MDELTVVTARRIEAEAIGGDCLVIGGHVPAMGSSDLRSRLHGRGPVALSGVAHGLDPSLRAGELVVASALWATDGTPRRQLPGAAVVAADLRRLGFTVRLGPLLSHLGPMTPAQRSAWAAQGVLAWDDESSWVAEALTDRPLTVVRTVVDTIRGEPVRTQLQAVGSLLGIRPSLHRWARACGQREVILAGPRSFCAGVERAIEIVERALDRFAHPVYVRRQIVHNAHVVAGLEAKGAIFVTELGEVPDGATVVLAAHGVSPAVRAEAAARPDLRVIDATCPLVAKVHHEARRYLADDVNIVLIGHAEHEEIVGTMGEGPERIWLVERAEDIDGLPFDEADRLAYLTQTTLATDETADVVAALRRRFPTVVGPKSHDICYATQNRQDAVRDLARHCDMVLVVGSANSSNSARLVEVARREGCRAELIEDADSLWLGWLDGVDRVGVSAGASAPEALVTGLVEALSSLGPVTVSEHRTTEESVQFSLPRQVR